jgi:dTDP-4-dehydrorhamnose reductase
VNVDAVAHLAEAAQRHGFTLVHVSSEYVFDGRHPGPIPEDLPPSPLSVYGRSKADGDRAAEGTDRHYLLRTTWLVGEGGNFVRTMASLAQRGVRPSVVDDQMGRPTFTTDLADAVAHLLATGAPFGTYNVTCAGEPASWAEVAAAVFEACGRAPGDVTPVSTAEYVADRPQAAARPRNSVLDLSKITATGFRPREWRSALIDYLDGLAADAAGPPPGSARRSGRR